MLAHHQPAHVREEKAARVVVRIGVRIGVLVMYTMISHPFPYAVLKGGRLQCDQDQSQRPLGLVRAMRPQAVRATRDTDRTEYAVEVACRENMMM